MTELPPASGRWRSSHKVAVLNLIRSGIVTQQDVTKRYGISIAELAEWQTHQAADPKHGLRADYITSSAKRKNLDTPYDAVAELLRARGMEHLLHTYGLTAIRAALRQIASEIGAQRRHSKRKPLYREVR